ncbi:glycosyltransferase [Plantactinospora sp. WMMB334]|uniref:glycosyltransferase n=1 Tax=Plantactinospora sp. WMMB334 TaxID=3404119 RepID=UPI003B944EB4
MFRTPVTRRRPVPLRWHLLVVVGGVLLLWSAVVGVPVLMVDLVADTTWTWDAIWAHELLPALLAAGLAPLYLLVSFLMPRPARGASPLRDRPVGARLLPALAERAAGVPFLIPSIPSRLESVRVWWFSAAYRWRRRGVGGAGCRGGVQPAAAAGVGDRGGRADRRRRGADQADVPTSAAGRRAMTARLAPRRVLAAAAVVLAAAAVWAAHHAIATAGLLTGAGGHRYTVVYAVMFGLLCWQLGLAYLETPATATRRKQRRLDALRVVAIVPAYNEDTAALRACLASMIGQSRRPQEIHVVDDGSTTTDYPDVRRWFTAACLAAGIAPMWTRVRNGGKRHAQAVAVRATPEADVYWTCDSDSVSDPEALHQLLLPFGDQRVQSVAGVVLAANVRSSFLTRFTDLWFVVGQLTDRSSLSALGSVWVNSGPIAVYRAAVVRDNLDGYLSETFFGRSVPFSDDSLLTLYAMLRGRTVQQPTAYAYSLMPESMSHHWRQFERWMRGSFIRSWWRVRYLAVGRPVWWLHLLRWITTVTALVVVVDVAVIRPIVSPSWETAAWLAAVPVIVGYAQCLRYMVVRRSDQSTGYQWATWALAPVAVVWSMTVLRACRWWAVATVLRSGWGTRSAGVEVALRPIPTT